MSIDQAQSSLGYFFKTLIAPPPVEFTVPALEMVVGFKDRNRAAFWHPEDYLPAVQLLSRAVRTVCLAINRTVKIDGEYSTTVLHWTRQFEFPELNRFVRFDLEVSYEPKGTWYTELTLAAEGFDPVVERFDDPRDVFEHMVKFYEQLVEFITPRVLEADVVKTPVTDKQGMGFVYPEGSTKRLALKAIQRESEDPQILTLTTNELSLAMIMGLTVVVEAYYQKPDGEYVYLIIVSKDGGMTFGPAIKLAKMPEPHSLVVNYDGDPTTIYLK